MSLADKVATDLGAVATKRLQKAGAVFVAAQRDALSEPGSNDFHSHPGEAPKSQTGRLAASFSFAVADGKLVVSSSAPYWQYLQKGTAKIAPRDVLAGLEAVQDRVDRIMKGAED